MTRIAWIGTGEMGSRMVTRLMDDGHRVAVYNRTARRADSLINRGAVRAATPAEAMSEAEVGFFMVSDAAALEDVASGPQGLGAGAGPGTIVVDMSTTGVGALRILRSTLPRGVGLLDAPVLGSVSEAAAGTLEIYVGGPADTVARVRPLLAAMGNPVHIGPSGAGAAAKLVANFALLSSVALLGEALALADRLDLARSTTWQVLEHSPLAAQATRRRAAIDAQSFPPRFPLSLARKDCELIATATTAAGADCPFVGALQAVFEAAAAAGLGDLDYTAVVSFLAAPGACPA